MNLCHEAIPDTINPSNLGIRDWDEGHRLLSPLKIYIVPLIEDN